MNHDDRRPAPRLGTGHDDCLCTRCPTVGTTGRCNLVVDHSGPHTVSPSDDAQERKHERAMERWARRSYERN